MMIGATTRKLLWAITITHVFQVRWSWNLVVILYRECEKELIRSSPFCFYNAIIILRLFRFGIGVDLGPWFQIETQKVDMTSIYKEKGHHSFDFGQVLSQQMITMASGKQLYFICYSWKSLYNYHISYNRIWWRLVGDGQFTANLV